jgi:iron complex transport system substrate-binding protein
MERRMNVNDVTDQILGAAVAIHTELGPGLLESVYEALLARALELRGLHCRRQQAVKLVYAGVSFDEAFRADLIVEDLVIVEIKSVVRLEPVFARQLLTYLRLTGKEVGLLINFGGHSVAGQTKRVVNNHREDVRTTSPSSQHSQSRTFRDSAPSA